MRIAFCFVGLSLLIGCSGNSTYTWGDASQQLGQIYCNGLAQCGLLAESELDVCYEHTSWHLCVPDGTCDRELDWDAAESAIAACSDAVDELDGFGCYLMAQWGVMPTECEAVSALEPMP